MTQYERMVKGLIYDPADPEIMNEQVPYQDKLWEFNQLKTSDYEKKQQYMHEVFAECGENSYIDPSRLQCVCQFQSYSGR